MDENLITKKELLELTGISYGSLYRWKRKNLIPDDWFIRRSTFTGHETFFPKDRILDRIARILELKEGMSLDDVAETLDPTDRDVRFTLEDIEQSGVCSSAVIDLYLARYGSAAYYDFNGLLSVYLFKYLLSTAMLSRDEACQVVDMYTNNREAIPLPRLICLRKLGTFFALITSEASEIAFDPDCAIVSDIPVQSLISSLKELLGGNQKDDNE